jgi:biofilm PGA synthesis lipoprotein PgaB
MAFAQDNRPFLTDINQFNYAHLLYEQGYYKVAAKEFGKVISDYPLSKLKADAHFRMIDSYMKAGLSKKAVSQLKQFLDNYPNSTLADGIRASLKNDVLNTRDAFFKLKGERDSLRRDVEGLKSELEEESRKRAVVEAELKAQISGLKEREAELVAKLETAKAVKAEIEDKIKPSEISLRKISEWETLRAVQVSVFEGKNYKEVAEEFDALKVSGVNAVIVRVFHNKGDRFYRFVTPHSDEGVYFSTQYVPVVADMLGRVIEIAHERDIKIFAWMTTRYANYGMGERYDIACKGYDVLSGSIVRCKGLDLFSEDAIRHLEGLYGDLADYDIDGILFQDDLILKHTEGFGEHAETLYRKDNGYALDPKEIFFRDEEGAIRYTPEFWKWVAWKNKRLLEVAQRLKTVIKEKRPGTKIALNLMYETVSDPKNALAWFSQNLIKATKGDFDYYAVMAYHRQMSEELEQDITQIKFMIEEMTSNAVNIVGDPQKVLIKLQTVDWKTSMPISSEEIYDILERVGKIKGVSMALFPYRVDIPFNKFKDM